MQFAVSNIACKMGARLSVYIYAYRKCIHGIPTDILSRFNEIFIENNLCNIWRFIQ